MKQPRPPVASELTISLTTNQSSVYGRTKRSDALNRDEQHPAQRGGLGWPQHASFFHHGERSSHLAIELWTPAPLLECATSYPSRPVPNRTANWTATSTGMFVVHNQMAPQGPVATFSVVANQPVPPVSPPVNPPYVSPPVGSELAISLTTNQTSYTVGQTVQMTLTATNDTNHNVTVWVGPNTQVFSITQNGQVIWRSNSGFQPLYDGGKSSQSRPVPDPDGELDGDCNGDVCRAQPDGSPRSRGDV